MRSFLFLCSIPLVVFFTVGCAKDSTSSENRKTNSTDFSDTDVEQRATVDENGHVVETHRYNYTLSKCTTGEQSFTSHLAFCQALRDEELNNNCAQNLRLREFESQQCKGDFYADNADLRLVAAASPEPRAEPRHSTPVYFDLDATFVSKSKSTVVNGNFLLTTLTGRLRAVNAASLQLSAASSVQITKPSMGVCNINSMTFSDLNEKGEVEFSISGKDDLRGGSANDSCLARVLTLGDAGFTVQFFDVPSGENEIVPVVSITVAQSEATNH